MKLTLNQLREYSPCVDGWSRLLKNLNKTKADDEEFSLLVVLESNGLDDALWCLNYIEGYDLEIKKLACDYALHVSHLWDMPSVVKQYLETQDENIRKEAYRAASAPACACASAPAPGAPASAAACACASASAYAAGARASAPAYAAGARASTSAYAAYAAEKEWQEQQLRELNISLSTTRKLT